MLLNTNQFSDINFIKEAVKGLTELPLEKFTIQYRPQTDKRTDVEYISEKIDKAFHINVESCKKMTFGEFAAMVNELDEYTQMFDTDGDSDDEARYISALVRKMLILNHRLPEIQIYNAINAKEYLNLLESLCTYSNTKLPAKDKKMVVMIKTMIANMPQNKTDMNLGYVLDILDKKACSFWTPWCNIPEDYVRNIREAYDMRRWLIQSASDIILLKPYKAADIIERYNGDLSFLDDPFSTDQEIISLHNIEKEQ